MTRLVSLKCPKNPQTPLPPPPVQLDNEGVKIEASIRKRLIIQVTVLFSYIYEPQEKNTYKNIHLKVCSSTG